MIKEIKEFYLNIVYHTPKDSLSETEIADVKKNGLLHLTYIKNKEGIEEKGVMGGCAKALCKKEKNFTWYYINDKSKFSKHVNYVYRKGYRKDYDAYVEVMNLSDEQISKLRIRRKHYDKAIIFPGTLKTSNITVNKL